MFRIISKACKQAGGSVLIEVGNKYKYIAENLTMELRQGGNNNELKRQSNHSSSSSSFFLYMIWGWYLRIRSNNILGSLLTTMERF